eukprot:CAMPEP_0181308006 /NCGR_PEP_ID=MMETSP1101-20121128/11209_1 /TAXON_ID=46948 /ORGANISM="Rhodomonas abbreviata, Strain Caron Lab Isolate" /LENGTH=256 /DNA_ID=CAMNT_0023414313 /DNA_START=34 /DNA_END=804 /DNA_ORIENTATION=-
MARNWVSLVPLLLVTFSVANAFAPASGPLLRRSAVSGMARRQHLALRTSMRLMNGQKPAVEVPGHAHEEVILLAKTIAVQETETEAAAKASKSGITINTAGMGQAPFWAAVIGGLTVFQMIKKKAAGRSVLDNKDVKYIAQNEEEEKELHIFACEGCGYEMMPAKGREGKFFPDDFKCPICGAPKEKFWDMNDEKDPRNQEKPEEEAKKPEAKADEGDKKAEEKKVDEKKAEEKKAEEKKEEKPDEKKGDAGEEKK